MAIKIAIKIAIFMRRKIEQRNIRKLFSRGGSTGLTIPKEFLRELRWRKGQKIQVRKRGSRLIIEDWKK